MKNIILCVPRVIGGIVRHPAEGPIPIAEKDLENLVEDVDYEVVDEEQGGDVDDGLDEEKVDDLKKIAADEGADLGEATKKADIIAAIRAHRAAQAE